MANGKLVLRKNEVKAMLQSQELLEVCMQHAERVGAGLGEGYEVSPYVGKTRVNASVRAVSDKAKQDTLDNNTLLKAVD